MRLARAWPNLVWLAQHPPWPNQTRDEPATPKLSIASFSHHVLAFLLSLVFLASLVLSCQTLCVFHPSVNPWFEFSLLSLRRRFPRGLNEELWPPRRGLSDGVICVSSNPVVVVVVEDRPSGDGYRRRNDWMLNMSILSIGCRSHRMGKHLFRAQKAAPKDPKAKGIHMGGSGAQGAQDAQNVTQDFEDVEDVGRRECPRGCRDCWGSTNGLHIYVN